MGGGGWGGRGGGPGYFLWEKFGFPNLIYCDQRCMVAIFCGVHIRLSTRRAICFILGLFAIIFSLQSLSLSHKSYECALKSNDLWITSLLFDLNNKFINGSFTFSPG